MTSAGASPPLLFAERLERAQALDSLSTRALGVVTSLIPGGPVRDALSGRWLGHALHPLLTDVPIGAWTSSLILDVIGGAEAEGAADLLIGVGIAAALPTAASGWADWSETTVESRRVGLVHAAANIAALTLFTGSLVQRRRGRRGSGRLLSMVAGVGVSAGGYLGGHLSYARGVGVGERTGSSFAADEPAVSVTVGY